MTTYRPGGNIIPVVFQSNYSRLNDKYTEVKHFIFLETGLNINFIKQSDYRDPLHNARVQGKPNSQHMKAEALDFHPKNYNIHKLFDILKLPENVEKLQFDQLILEYDKKLDEYWIHFSIPDLGKPPRGDVYYLTKGGRATKIQQTIHQDNKLPSSQESTSASNKVKYDSKKPFLQNLAAYDDGKAVENLKETLLAPNLKKRMAKSRLKKLLERAIIYNANHPQVKT